jgi:hypothetical protein
VTLELFQYCIYCTYIICIFIYTLSEGYNPSSPSLDTSNATPIPLGPSSVRPPVKASVVLKPRSRYQNNRPSDEEEDYFLQRSETGDRRLQQEDLLRYSYMPSIPGRDKGFFLWPLCPDQLWGPPSLLSNGYSGGFFLWELNLVWAWHWPLASI